MPNKLPQSEPKPVQQLALWADKLRQMSANGLRFASNIYDRDNYRHVQEIAMGLFALATAQSVEALEPLRASVFSHPSPIATVDAAIIDEEGRLLLIQRADNRKWAMPGGGLDVGETPAQGAVREALEVTGVACEPVQLVAVHDSRFCGAVAAHQLYMFTFLCRPLAGTAIQNPASHAHEVVATGWFREEELPFELDSGHVSRIPLVFDAWRGNQRAYFDK